MVGCRALAPGRRRTWPAGPGSRSRGFSPSSSTCGCAASAMSRAASCSISRGPHCLTTRRRHRSGSCQPGTRRCWCMPTAPRSCLSRIVPSCSTHPPPTRFPLSSWTGPWPGLGDTRTGGCDSSRSTPFHVGLGASSRTRRSAWPPSTGTDIVEAYICVTCGVQRAPSDRPPRNCPICEDERQYVRQGGQTWTTLTELKASGHRVELRDLEPGLTGVGIEPALGIGQRALLVQDRKSTRLNSSHITISYAVFCLKKKKKKKNKHQHTQQNTKNSQTH